MLCSSASSSFAPCYYESGKPGNWRSCKRAAHWRIKSAAGGFITYCDYHKRIIEPKMVGRRLRITISIKTQSFNFAF